MLTPQEIMDTKFEKAVFGGYDMAQIDKFLDELLVDYTSLYKENAALKGKMRVLVDKIDEYREVDEQMRKALYTAQVTAKEIEDKANAEAKVIIANAETEAKKIGEKIERETYANSVKLREMRDICTRYSQTVRTLMEKAVSDISLTEDKSIDEIINNTLIPDSLKVQKSFDIKIPENDLNSMQVVEGEEPTIDIRINDQEVSCQPEEDPDKVFDIDLIKEIAEESAADASGEDDEAEPNDEYDEEDTETEEITDKPERRFKFNFSEFKFGKNYKNQD